MRIFWKFKSPRLFFLIVVIIITPIGFATKFYRGPFESWMMLYAGDILYPIFWYFLFLFFFPNFNPYLLAVLNLTVDCLGEFSQQISTPLLIAIRKNFIGRTIIGSGFDSNDFIYYIIGNILAIIIYFFISRTIITFKDAG